MTEEFDKFVQACLKDCREAAKQCLEDGILSVPKCFVKRNVDFRIHGDIYSVSGWVDSMGRYHNISFSTFNGKETLYIDGVKYEKV